MYILMARLPVGQAKMAMAYTLSTQMEAPVNIARLVANYNAEVATIKTALELLRTQMQTLQQMRHNIVLFTNAMSARQSLEEYPRS